MNNINKLQSNKKYSEDYIMLKFRLKINQKLYDSNIISFEIFKDMGEMLVKRINIISSDLNIFSDDCEGL